MSSWAEHLVQLACKQEAAVGRCLDLPKLVIVANGIRGQVVVHFEGPLAVAAAVRIGLLGNVPGCFEDLSAVEVASEVEIVVLVNPQVAGCACSVILHAAGVFS